ncbi:hypothetical protein BDY21DRAFT_415391 [Lineolata rhizophorae]|uniref:C2 domain-containing protein n=1 Tax=Lineolata rhizophorae TaxID=578093 RepID=A0A6A6NY62_9PEZI|nr:hypothetical protein BDY21DRAFT_415391 [Lineolata rhizophorae]
MAAGARQAQPPSSEIKADGQSHLPPKQPAGGFDPTPVPYIPPGWTVKITFHRAINLPISDLNTLSSDPFIEAQIYTALPTRHKEDPPLRMRTHTVRHSVDPEWNFEWILANVPSSGFKLKARVYDEDQADHDDRLGNAHINVGHLEQGWPGLQNHRYRIKKRMGSKRAYLLRIIAVCLNKARHLDGYLFVSMELLGRTEDPEGGARVYTIGHNWWTRHYSPLLGRITGSKDSETEAKSNGRRAAQRYNFQANQIQLRGPVPSELYHRYVEFKPFVKGMFTRKGIAGILLNKALHHQHARVYNFDRNTVYGMCDAPCKELTMQFLDLVHHDRGGRIFTYVLTLDALFRFTETGKEFGIDMLSKHTMHSDVSVYIAYSGEFLVRRLKHPHRRPPEEGGRNQTHPPDDIGGGPPDEDPPRDPERYELIIDNDSGTYRPSGALLPQLRRFLEANLPGLKIVALDCLKDAALMDKLKGEQRERKRREGRPIIYTQRSSTGSISSSDEEALDALEANGEPRERGVLAHLQKDMAAEGQAKLEHWKRLTPGQKVKAKEQGVQPPEAAQSTQSPR